MEQGLSPHQTTRSRNKLHNFILTRALRRKYESSLGTNRTTNVKQFWEYLNSRLKKTCPSINSLRCDDNSIVDSGLGKGNGFLLVSLPGKTVHPSPITN